MRKIFALSTLALVAGAALANTPSYEFRTPTKGLSVRAPVGAPGPAPAPAPAPAPTKTATTSASALSFTDTTVGVTDLQQVLLTNTGNTALSLSPPTTSNEVFSATTNCTASLAPAQSCQVDVLFTPARGQIYSGSLSFVTDASPAVAPVTLTGKGLRVEPTFAAQTDGDFGATVTGTTATRIFTFTNNGTVAAQGVVASVAGQNVSLGTNTCGVAGSPVTVAEGASCSVTARYSPTVNGEVLSGGSVSVSGANFPSQSQPLTGSGVSPADPFFANTVALLKFDGVQGSTSFTMTKGGSTSVSGPTLPSITTIDKKFGTGAGNFVNGKIIIARQPEYQLGVENFTIEFWARFARAVPTSSLEYIAHQNHQPGPGTWSFVRDLNGNSTINFYSAQQSGGGCARITSGLNIAAGVSYAANEWVHIAVVREGRGIRTYFNGAKTQDNPNYFPSVSTALCNDGDNIYLGQTGNAAAAPFVGQLDDFRITKGIARYSVNFTPAEAPTR